MNGFPHMKEEGVYEFTEDGFRISRPSLEITQPWKSVHSVVELKNEFLLFTNPGCFHAVPKRFIPPELAAPWRDFVSARLATLGKRIV